MDKENKLTPTSHTKQSKGQPLRELATALATAKSRPASFMASVVSISEDQSIAKVKLCTGAIFDVPVSILKDVIHLGTMTSGGECLGIASAQIDVSTEVGMLIQQMASEINLLSLSLQATKDSLIKLQGKDCNRAITPPDEKQVTRTKIIPLDKLLPTEYILLKFNEIAGKSSAVTYNAPTHQYIEDYEIQQINGCQLLGVSEQRLIGLLIGLVFGVDAVHETPFGTPYTGNILIRVNLVQMET